MSENTQDMVRVGNLVLFRNDELINRLYLNDDEAGRGRCCYNVKLRSGVHVCLLRIADLEDDAIDSATLGVLFDDGELEELDWLYEATSDCPAMDGPPPESTIEELFQNFCDTELSYTNIPDKVSVASFLGMG